MDKNLHDIENLFKKKLEDNEEPVHARVWNNITHELDKDNFFIIKRKYNSLKKLAAVLLFFLSVLIINEIIKKDYGFKNTNQFKRMTELPAGRGFEQNEIKKNSSKKIIPHQQVSFTKTNSNKLFAQANGFADVLEHSDNYNTTGNIAVSENPQAYKNDYALNEINEEEHWKAKLNQHLHNSENIIDSFKIEDLASVTKPLTKAEFKNTLHDSKHKSLTTSRFSLSFLFSPDYAFYHLEDDKPDNIADNANTLSSKESHDFSSTVSALLNYKLNKRWSLQSGITFSNINITVQPKTIYARHDNNGNIKYRINTSSGYGYVLPSFSANPVIGDSLYAFTSSHSLQYISVPFAATYAITQGKFKIIARAGGAMNFLTKARIETTVEKGFNNETEIVNKLEALKSLYYSGFTGIGVNYALSKKLTFTFEPVVRFALNSINKDAVVKSYPMSAGLAVGVKISL